MNPKILWCSGLALPVLLATAALTACGYKTTDYSRPSTAVALLRFNANGTPGTLDTSFGTQGVVTKDVDTFQDDVAFATVLQPDGKIIVVGTSFTTPARVVVIRYDATGAPDPTFGTNGITVTSLPSADASAFAATLQTDGKLLVAGRSCPLSGGSSFLLLRYNTAGAPGTVGTLDASFAGTGIVTTAIPSGSSTSANAVAVSGTDILVAGHSKIGGRFVIALARYDSSGAPVSTFGNSGIVTTPVGSLDADAVALAVQPDGKIVAAGLAGNAVSQIWDVALLRYNANGSLDTDPNPTMGFGGGTGIVTTDIGSSSNYANAVALQADGKIVVAGNAFADLLMGKVSQFQQENQQLKYYNRYKVVEPYFQDDWRITNKLTLNLGLRVSMFGTYSEKYRQAYSFDPAKYVAGGSPAFDVNGSATGTAGAFIPGPGNPFNGIVQCGGPGGAVSVPGFPDAASGGTSYPGCMKGHLFNPAPRIGFAWDPKGDGKMAIRGGYGIFYEHTNGNEGNTESLEGTPPLVLSPVQNNIDGYGAIGGAIQLPLAVKSIPSKAIWPYVQQWHLDVQKELPSNVVATVSYVGSKGTHLTLQRNLNQLFPVPLSQNP